MTGYGDRIQYSVFVCDLSPKEFVFMKADLIDLINADEDKVMMVDLGSADKDVDKRITAIGMNLDGAREASIVI